MTAARFTGISTGRSWATLVAASATALLASAASAQTIYVSNEKDNTLSVIDGKSMAVTDTIKVGKRPRGITLSKDGTQLFICASDDHAVQVLDLASKKIVHNLPSGEDPEQFALSPDGKSLFIADTMKSGKVVSLDEPASAGKPGEPGKVDLRLVRLKENLSRAPAGVDVALVEADLRKVNTVFYRNLNLPESYDAVLLDAPCSNTGVMRHRIDVKWRLQDGDFARHAEQQLELLHAAARLVKPGGRLVYSTCSIDAQENEQVIKAFFDSRAGGPFKLEKQVLAYPWKDGHDGAGAFLLKKG